MLPTELALLTQRLEEGADDALSTVRALAGIAGKLTSPPSTQAGIDGVHNAIETIAKEISTMKYDAARVRALADAHIDTLNFVFDVSVEMVDTLRRESAQLGASFKGYEALIAKVGEMQASITANFPGPELPGRG
jgi:hypothetical protein